MFLVLVEVRCMFHYILHISKNSVNGCVSASVTHNNLLPLMDNICSATCF